MVKEVINNPLVTIQNIALAAMIALLGWNVTTTQKLSIDVARIEERTQDFTPGVVEQRLGRLEEWNANLSRRLADIENTLRDGK